jgi:MHS family shikimate/dehydroshikimate transporter-like MFS transporter
VTAIDALSLTDRATPSRLRHIVLASVLGTTVEWYDFLIYGMGAALVFNKLFFPNFDPLVGTLAAFGSYAVGFVARPVGGAIFGHFGDRLGRKAMLTLTMIIMGGGTFLIGLLPTYEHVGILAPILLIVLRLMQGIGIGGEWGGAVLMVIESGDAKRRGFLGSLVQVGFPLGLVAATIVFSAVAKLPEAEFLSWGWRVPFLVSFLLVGVGLFVRLKLVETPKFESLRARDEIAKLPIVDVLVRDWKNFLIAVGLKVSEVAWVYILTVFLVFYAATKLSLPRALILDAVLYGALLELVMVPLFGLLSDRVGRKPLYITGAVFSVLFAFPLFQLLDSKDPTTITLTIAVAMSLCH